MKAYKVDRTNGDKELENNSQVTIFHGYTELYNNLDNLEEGQIVGLVSNTEIPVSDDPEDGSLVYFDDDKKEYVPTTIPDGIGQVLTSNVDESGRIYYEWKQGGVGSVSVFDTLVEAELALEIPEGQDGYIPNNGVVIVKELNEYVYKEDR